jgi:hypothetical protein
VAFLEVVDEGMQVEEVEAAAGVIPALERKAIRTWLEMRDRAVMMRMNHET